MDIEDTKIQRVNETMSEMDIGSGYWNNLVAKIIVENMRGENTSDKGLRKIVNERLKDINPDDSNNTRRKRFDRARDKLIEFGYIMDVQHHYRFLEPSAQMLSNDLYTYLIDSIDTQDIVLVIDRLRSYVIMESKLNYSRFIQTLKGKFLVKNSECLSDISIFKSLINLFRQILIKYDAKILEFTPESIKMIKIDFINCFKSQVKNDLEYLDGTFLSLFGFLTSSENVKFIIDLIICMPEDVWIKEKTNIAEILCSKYYPMRKYNENLILKEIAALEKDDSVQIKERGEYLHDVFIQRSLVR